jgi:hypothetical protein
MELREDTLSKLIRLLELASAPDQSQASKNATASSNLGPIMNMAITMRASGSKSRAAEKVMVEVAATQIQAVVRGHASRLRAHRERMLKQFVDQACAPIAESIYMEVCMSEFITAATKVHRTMHANPQHS